MDVYFREGQAPNMVFHFPYLGCVPESASNSGQKGGSRFGPGFSQFLRFFALASCLGFGPRRGLNRNSKLFTERLPSSESLLPSGNKYHTCGDTREPRQMPGPREGR